MDDLEEQRELTFKIPKKLYFSVCTVSSDDEPIYYMKNIATDLLILDMIMDPRIDGLEIYNRILKLHPNQKEIIASKFSETKRIKEA